LKRAVLAAMSDLQIALLAIGIALIAAVFAYNKWQEARFRRLAENGVKSGHADVLLHSSAQAEAPAGPAGRVEPVWADEGEAIEKAPVTSPAPASKPSTAVLSEAIDFMVTLEAPAPVAGRSLLEAAPPVLARFGKRVRFEGHGSEGWEPLVPEQSYRQMRAGLQLVDRRGAIRQEDLQAFCSDLARAAGVVGATIAEGAHETGLATAARLDRFCEQVDIQIAVHVVPAAAVFPGTKIRALAEAAGLSLEQDGRFHHRDERGQESFVLANEEKVPFSSEAMKALSTGALLLELEVPRAPGGAVAFERFRRFAEQLAAGLGGKLVDDNRAPLDRAAFEAISAQLAPVYDSMRAQGIPAGSPLALRLFS